MNHNPEAETAATTFHSRGTNTDPLPWVNRIDISQRAATPDAFPETIRTHGVSHEPRPQFDNRPNKILVAFRQLVAAFPERDIAGLAERAMQCAPVFDDAMNTPAHQAHARRVLTRIARIYKTEEA